MSSYSPCQDHLDFVAHFRFYPVFVAFDVEDHSVFAQKTGVWISRLNIYRPSPICILNLVDPSPEGIFDVGVASLELIKEFSSD